MSAAGRARMYLVDLLIEPARQGGEDLVLLRLRELACRDRRIEIRLRGCRERGVEAVDRLAVGRRDGGERLAARQLRAQLSGRDADVRRGRVEGDGAAAEAGTAVPEAAVAAAEGEERRLPRGQPRLGGR